MSDHHHPQINQDFLRDTLIFLFNTHSPSGFCHELIEAIEKRIAPYGFEFEVTQKGCGIITIPGLNEGPTLGLCAHIDTLGAMVRSITSHGTLKFTLLGGPIVPTLDSEYCTIRTREGKQFTGTFLSTSPAAHVYDDSGTKKRDPQNMEIRIDERVSSKEDVLALGINNGDYIFIDPKTTITTSGFIKSRFIDDKGSVACLLSLIDYYAKTGERPKQTTKIILSVYEEVGHGSAYIPDDIQELIAVDMGCIGDDLSCTEYDVSICAKDSAGPYDYHLTNKLVDLAQSHKIPFAVDIYPYYSSDISAALKGGNNIKGALIGPGVHASHGMERTHFDALEGTIRLLYHYLKA